ncbi:MAG: methyltransferase domain-containing protein [Methanobacteriota archaeon]
MREDLVGRLACPRCRKGLYLEAAERAGGDVRVGRLVCEACATSYPIRDGIPRMVVGEGFVGETQRAFGAQWARRQAGRFESEFLFGLTREEEQRMFFDALDLRPEDLRHRWVLDAGCGSGRLTRGLASFGGDVVGLDVAPTIDYVGRQAAALPNLHLVQGSLLDIPLADDAFDVVWSMGVIHHTGDTPRAFANLARVVRPGGRLYVWVYSSRKLSLYKVIRDAVRFSHRVRKDLLFYLCYMMAPPLKLYHTAKFAVRSIRGRPVTPRERREAQIRTIAFELHDDLAPPFQTRHVPGEVLGWFRDGGFEDLVVVDEVGVRGFKGSRGRSAAPGESEILWKGERLRNGDNG